MDDKILVLIERMADKLGTTSDKLWAILLKQALIEGVTDFIILAFFAYLLFVLAKVVQKNSAAPESTDKK